MHSLYMHVCSYTIIYLHIHIQCSHAYPNTNAHTVYAYVQYAQVLMHTYTYGHTLYASTYSCTHTDTYTYPTLLSPPNHMAATSWSCCPQQPAAHVHHCSPPPPLTAVDTDSSPVPRAGEDSVGLSFQLATLDYSGKVNPWVAVEIYHPDPPWIRV